MNFKIILTFPSKIIVLQDITINKTHVLVKGLKETHCSVAGPNGMSARKNRYLPIHNISKYYIDWNVYLHYDNTGTLCTNNSLNI